MAEFLATRIPVEVDSKMDQSKNRQTTTTIFQSAKINFDFEVVTDADGAPYLSLKQSGCIGAQEVVRQQLTIPISAFRTFHDAYLQAVKHFIGEEKTRTIEDVRQSHPEAYKKWTASDDKKTFVRLQSR